MTDSLVDSHCHIPMIEGIGSAEDIIGDALDNQVEHMLCVSIDLESYPDILDLARSYHAVSASVGVHPNTPEHSPVTVESLVELVGEPTVIAIGETGLDYFRSEGDLEWQRQRFRNHIRAARETGKPLIIHSRDAKEDVINILREEKAQEVGGVMHCFVDDLETAKKAIDLDFHISFSGIVTFKNAQDLKEVARRIPLDKLLVETDSPYLAPVPHRGKTNRPAYVRHVAEHIAELRDTSFSAIANASTSNFYRLFFPGREAAPGTAA